MSLNGSLCRIPAERAISFLARPLRLGYLVGCDGKLSGCNVPRSWRGQIKQRLVVHPDMSGLYGTVPIKKVNLEDGRVDFMMVMEFGDQTFEMNFDGKLAESKLTGEMTTSQGTQKIKGTKVIRPSRRRRTM